MEAAETVPVAEAAKRLRVSTRTIFRQLQRGNLRRAGTSYRRGVLPEDLELLKQAEAEPPPRIITRQSLEFFVHTVQVLRHEVDLCIEALDLGRAPLDLSAEELVERQSAARRLVEAGDKGAGWRWIDFLFRLRDGDLRAIQKATGDDEPWRPFYELAGMIQGPGDRRLSRLIGAACEHIERLTQAWLAKKKGSGRRAND